METLSPLLFSIRIGLFVMSGMLMLSAVIGLYLNAQTLSDIRLGLFSSKETDAAPALNSQSEKRREPRYKSAVALDLADASGRPVPRPARLLNISRTGVCFYSALSLWRGERIQAYLYSSKKNVLKISGRVVWQKPSGRFTLYGISLDNFLPAEYLA